MIRDILHHLKSKWYEYILEIFVVIMGILIANNLDKWSDARGNKKKEIEMLKEFKRGLSVDLVEMRKIVRSRLFGIYNPA